MHSNNDNHAGKSCKSNIISFSATSNKAKIEPSEEERRQELLKTLDILRDKVADGTMDDVVIIARNTQNNLYFTEMSVRQSTYNSSDIGTLSALLNTLSTEFNAMFLMTPFCDVNGDQFTYNSEV